MAEDPQTIDAGEGDLERIRNFPVGGSSPVDPHSPVPQTVDELNRRASTERYVQTEDGRAIRADNAALDAGSAWDTGTVEPGAGGTDVNPLDDYINISYHLRLQMMPHPDGETTYDDLAGRTDGITFASSGGRFDETKGFFKIESFSMRTVEGVTATNPEIALVVEAKLKLSEPHGLSFDKVMREKAGELGWSEGLPTRIIWRMDVGFSGYNPSTGEWVSRIPIPNNWTGSSNDNISYFFNFTALDTTVNFMGSEYEINLVPFMQTAIRPEELYIDASNFHSDPTYRFSSFIEQLEENLNAESERIFSENGGTRYRYDIEIAPLPDGAPADLDISEEQFIFDAFADRHDLLQPRTTAMGTTGSAENEGFIVHVGPHTSILWILMQSLRELEKVRVAFLREGDTNRVAPRTTYIVRPEIHYVTTERSGVSNDFSEILLRYVIEPYLDWRYTFNNNAVQVNEEYQRQRLSSMIQVGALRRTYNYMYTPDNSEIIDLDTKFKFFFYEELGKHDDESSDHNAGGSSAATAEENEERRGADDATSNEGGSNSTPEPHGNQSSGTNTENLSMRRTSPTPHDSGGPGEDYDKAFENMLKNDMLTLEGMKVRGDPQWLYVRNLHALSYVGTANVIRLNVWAPNPEQYMNPNSTTPIRDQSIGGFFEILQVEHTFEGGSFEQVLSGYKLRGLSAGL